LFSSRFFASPEWAVHKPSIPTFHGPGLIKGHEFGLKLAPEDREALIAFLKTL
jgi:hypothetical protein